MHVFIALSHTLHVCVKLTGTAGYSQVRADAADCAALWRTAGGASHRRPSRHRARRCQWCARRASPLCCTQDKLLPSAHPHTVLTPDACQAHGLLQAACVRRSVTELRLLRICHTHGRRCVTKHITYLRELRAPVRRTSSCHRRACPFAMYDVPPRYIIHGFFSGCSYRCTLGTCMLIGACRRRGRQRLHIFGHGRGLP